MAGSIWRRKAYQAGILLLLLFLTGCAQQAQNPFSDQSWTNTKAFSVPGQTPVYTPDTKSFTLAGSAVWILSCLDGWNNHKIYQSNPYYTDQNGVKKVKDLYIYGHFWLQPDTGKLWPYTDKPEVLQCLDNALNTVHLTYHGRVCAVLGVDEVDSNGWKSSDVVGYTKRVLTNPDLLAPIVEQVKKFGYDCLINDIEDGDRNSPQDFSQYDALLHSRLPVPLGQTLLWKTPEVSAYWQKWQDWSTMAGNADFFIVMALDHDSIDDPPVPASVVNEGWLEDVYAYAHSMAGFFGSRPVAWELPTYYRLFTQRGDGSWSVAGGTDAAAQISIAQNSKAIQDNQLENPYDPYLEYTNAQQQDTYLFVETPTSSDVLAQYLSQTINPTCLLLSFWDSDSGTSNTLGWANVLNDRQIKLC